MLISVDLCRMSQLACPISAVDDVLLNVLARPTVSAVGCARRKVLATFMPGVGVAVMIALGMLTTCTLMSAPLMSTWSS